MDSKGEARKVLLIEDDVLISDILARKLSHSGLHVLHAASGPAAFAILEKGERPDVVLLDLILPGMDGFEILKKLKADKEYAAIPVIILSNVDEQKEIDRAKDLGALDFLVKVSVPLEEVVKRVQSICKV